MQTARFTNMMYNTLASYYDQLVRDDEAADGWVHWVESFQPGQTFLELACGSGEITRRLAETHEMTALDLSQQMIEAAQKKEGCEEIRFVQGNMCDLSALPTYDSIGCFCDSFNYLLSIEQIEGFFKEVYDHLKPGGLFFFDSHSLDRLDEFEEEYIEAGQFADGTQLQWNIASQDEFLFQDFAFYFADRTIQEHHMQRVYRPDELLQALKPYFEVLSVSTDWERPGFTEGEKYFLVCRKKEAAGK